jgi:hypothetical protein
MNVDSHLEHLFSPFLSCKRNLVRPAAPKILAVLI